MHESGEMYLETIYVLCEKKPSVRSVDVAEYMGFSKPSVSRGVNLLKASGYINIDEKGYLTLTDSGMDLAKKIYERHTLLTVALRRLGVDDKTAETDACRIEHIISDAAFDAIKKHMGK